MVSSELGVVPGAPATTVRRRTWASLPATEAAALDIADMLRRLGSCENGLSAAEADRRLAEVGPNALRDHRARFWPVLARQLRSALLLLLLATAAVSFALGERSDAVIIASILAASVGLGCVMNTVPNGPARRCTARSGTVPWWSGTDCPVNCR
jgi:magnesium-transporting ATPase (P-type)